MEGNMFKSISYWISLNIQKHVNLKTFILTMTHGQQITKKKLSNEKNYMYNLNGNTKILVTAGPGK